MLVEQADRRGQAELHAEHRRDRHRGAGAGAGGCRHAHQSEPRPDIVHVHVRLLDISFVRSWTMPAMDVRRLALLLELSRLGSMREVAEALHTTTSTVSQQLAALAREVGHPAARARSAAGSG